MRTRMHADELDLDEGLVRRLLADQAPELADRPLTVVEPWGTDNAIWRVGEDLVVRLPRRPHVSSQVDREDAFLPLLAPHLPVEVPEPLLVGQPIEGYPCRWAIHRWIDGVGASIEGMADPSAFARDLAAVVRSLQAVDTASAPPARNRARPLADYDEVTRLAIGAASRLIDARAAMAIWEEALDAPPHGGAPVWVHGDLEGNCILRDGRLCGIVDWGLGCAGDPAVEVQTAWSPLFDETSRAVFLEALDVDDATLARARGAAINQACAALPYYLDTYPLIVERSWHKLAALGVHPIDGG